MPRLPSVSKIVGFPRMISSEMIKNDFSARISSLNWLIVSEWDAGVAEVRTMSPQELKHLYTGVNVSAHEVQSNVPEPSAPSLHLLKPPRLDQGHFYPLLC